MHGNTRGSRSPQGEAVQWKNLRKGKNIVFDVTKLLKWEMGEYHWRSYAQIDERTNLVGSGLEAIGHKEGFVVLFAETREEWTTTAFACFKKNYPSMN